MKGVDYFLLRQRVLSTGLLIDCLISFRLLLDADKETGYQFGQDSRQEPGSLKPYLPSPL